MKFIIIFFIFLLICTTFIGLNKPEKHDISRGEQLVNEILAKTAKLIKKKYNLFPSGAGAAMPGGPIQELTLCFDTKYPYKREELRKLLIKTAYELLRQVEENNEIQQFLNEQPFKIRNVEIIIFNHDKCGKILFDPEIAVARISDAILIYRTNDPENEFKYKNQFEESYEEARQILGMPNS